MAKKHLTEAMVEKLRPPQSGRVEILDALLPGLQLRVTDRGVKSWALLYRVAGAGGVGSNGLGRRGTLKRATLGHFPLLGLKAARDKARAALALADSGRDPVFAREDELVARQKAAANTVRAVAAKFIERYCKQQKKLRGWRDTEGVFRNHIFPALGDRPISDVKKQDITLLLDRLAGGPSPEASNKTFCVLRKMFKWSVWRGISGVPNLVGLGLPVKRNPRRHVLTNDELVALWHAAETLGYPFGDVIRLLILTAQRRDEIATATWAWVDFDKATLTVPGEEYKSGNTHLVPLSEPALPILQAVPRFAGGKFLFSTTAGLRPISGFSRYKRRLDAAMLAELRRAAEQRGEDPALVGLRPWRIHDLRRTAATGMAQCKVKQHVRARVLGHTQKDVTGQHYDMWEYADEKREALSTWAVHVMALLGKAPSAKILNLPPRA
jgi:integrase